MEAKPMTKLIDALTARTRFGELMEQIDKNQARYLVSRRGKPKVIMLSVRDYLQNIVKKSDILVELQADAKKAGKENITMEEIDAEIKAYRKDKAENKK